MNVAKKKKYQSPVAMAKAFVDGTGFVSHSYYELYARDYNGKPVAVVNTAGLIGGATGMTTWKIEVLPHPWAQEIADEIWRTKWEKPTKESKRPGRNVCKAGWNCAFLVQLEFSGVEVLEAE
jgi:hypothetical protein